jgi:hypothetical protein
MLRRRLQFLRFHFRGRGGSWLALLGQLIALVGLPLPVASAKDLSSPFPCQHRACGCMSAADCWKSCCCFSAAERVGWAREHGVEPPAALVEEAEQEHPCCHSGSNCSHGSTEPSDKPTDPVQPKKTHAESGTRWLIVIQARRCHGTDTDTTSVGPIAMPLSPALWQFDWTPAGNVGAISLIPISLSRLPLPPPPRSC